MKKEREKALIVGLGNPGKEYEKTRHNFGQTMLFAFAEKHRLSFKRETSLQGKIAVGDWKNKQMILLFPTTYMNLSGRAVGQTMRFYKVEEGGILILSDDADLPFGTLRFKEKGSFGGHNGLKSIQETLNTFNYRRLKLGIGRGEENGLKDHVLSPFTKEEQEKIPEITTRAVGIIEGWLSEEIKEYE